MRISYGHEARDVGPLALPRGRAIGTLAGLVPAHAAAYLSCVEGGRVWVPLDARAPADRLGTDLAELGVDALVRHHGTGSPVRWQGPTLDVADWTATDRAKEASADGLPAGTASVQQLETHGGMARFAIRLRTSGTSGPPKVVDLTDGQLAAHAHASGPRLGQDEHSIAMACLPLHHAGGAVLLDRARRLGSGVRMARWEAATALDQLARVTHASLVPAQLAQVASHPAPRGLSCVLVGGDALPEPLFRQALSNGWPVHPSYGLTEACGQVATATPSERTTRPGTTGRPLDGVRVRIVDDAIVVDGPTVAGTLHTGDWGALDDDGFLFVHGRAGDRITTGGEKVDPAVVEAALRTHPAVAAACVVGLPDPVWGQVVAAAVVVRERIAWSDLRAHVAPRLRPAEVPRVWREAEDLPRTPSGKLMRAHVRRDWEAGGTHSA